jgi:hypothetical protein
MLSCLVVSYSGAGAMGATAPVAQTVRGQHGGSTGATGCLFYRNCNSKFVRYSQEFEFRTIFKQCLSNLCLIFNQFYNNAESGNIRPFTDFIFRP